MVKCWCAARPSLPQPGPAARCANATAIGCPQAIWPQWSPPESCDSSAARARPSSPLPASTCILKILKPESRNSQALPPARLCPLKPPMGPSLAPSSPAADRETAQPRQSKTPTRISPIFSVCGDGFSIPSPTCRAPPLEKCGAKLWPSGSIKSRLHPRKTTPLEQTSMAPLPRLKIGCSR